MATEEGSTAAAVRKWVVQNKLKTVGKTPVLNVGSVAEQHNGVLRIQLVDARNERCQAPCPGFDAGRSNCQYGDAPKVDKYVNRFLHINANE